MSTSNVFFFFAHFKFTGFLYCPTKDLEVFPPIHITPPTHVYCTGKKDLGDRIKGDFSREEIIIVLCCCRNVLIAVLGPSLEPSHAVVPLISPFDHYRPLRQHQPVPSFAVVLLAEYQVKPAKQQILQRNHKRLFRTTTDLI